MKKIIINERQEILLAKLIREGTDHEVIVSKIVKDLDANYELIAGTFRKGGEYFAKPMLKIKIDGEITTPKDVLKYLRYKYKINESFLKQLILDWINGDIKDNKLSKNISID